MTKKYLLLNPNSTITIIHCHEIGNEVTTVEVLHPHNLLLQSTHEHCLYCGHCSGVYGGGPPIVQCFHCQWKYRIECPAGAQSTQKHSPQKTDSLKMPPPLPNNVINFLRLKGFSHFNQSSLIKTRKKEDYRCLYEHLIEKHTSSQIPPSLIHFISEFSDIVNAHKFTDDLLENLDAKYLSSLKFSIDSYNLI